MTEWKVGDPDPTPPPRVARYCGEATPDEVFVCTWPAGHTGQHVAGTGKTIAAVWGDRLRGART